MANTQNASSDSDVTKGYSSAPISASEVTGNSEIAHASDAASSKELRAKKRKKGNSNSNRRDRYQTVGQLGRGGWGVVEEAVDRQLQRSVAIKRIASGKTIAQEVRDRFLHEAKVTSQLQHPGIVPVHELEDGQSNGDVYYVMKLLSGKPLRQLIRDTHSSIDSAKCSPHKLREAILPLLERFVDVCDAIAYAHQQGVLHRDLKPDNVMIGGFGETIVVDWGLAKRYRDVQQSAEDATIDAKLQQVAELVEGEISYSGQTLDGSVIGTPAYMSPEQAHGNIAELSPASDIYSLGVMLYEILVGQHPHAGMDVHAVLARVRVGEYSCAKNTRPAVPRPLSAICDRAMALAPSERYASAADLAEDVKCYIAGDAVSVDQENVLEKISRWCKRHQTLAFTFVGTSLTLLIASLVAGLMIHKAHRSEQAAHLATQSAHKETLDRLRESRNAADAWLIDLSGSLQFYPGLQPVRDKLIDDAIAHYQELLDWENNWIDDEKPNDDSYGYGPTVDRETLSDRIRLQMTLERIKVCLRLGDLHRLKNANDLAKEQYDSAYSQLKTCLNESITDQKIEDDLRLQLANVTVGKLLLQDAGDDLYTDLYTQVKTWLDDRLNSGGAVDESQAKASEFLYDLVSCRSRLSLAKARSLAELDAAMVVSEAATAVRWAKWLAKSRGRFSDIRLLQTCTTQWAEAIERTGDFGAAASAWQQLVHQLEQAGSEYADRIDHLQSLAYARLRLANAMSKSAGQDQNTFTSAKQEYQLAIGEFKNAWTLSDADGFYQRNLASAEYNLGNLLAGGDVEAQNEAREHLHTSLGIRKRLIGQQPSVEEIRLYCDAIIRSVELDWQLGAKPGMSLLTEADVCYQLIREYGHLAGKDRTAWSKVLRLRAQQHEAAGNHDDAVVDRANADQLEASQ
jgi:eukaryotic-like serine/threonine-protein kinase